MKDKTEARMEGLTAFGAIIGITVLSGIAMLNGINGMLTALAMSAIAGLGGYSLGIGLSKLAKVQQIGE